MSMVYLEEYFRTASWNSTIEYQLEPMDNISWQQKEKTVSFSGSDSLNDDSRGEIELCQL